MSADQSETVHANRPVGRVDGINGRRLAAETVKQAEDRIQVIIDTIPIMAWSLRPDGIVDFLNQRWLDYTGLSLEAYVKDPTGPIHPDDIPRVLEKWQVQMPAAEPCEDELRLRRADGAYRWFLIRTVPLLDEQGNVVKWYGTSTDIEELKTTGEELRALSARLQSAREEECTRIAREIHDELGAMLTGLRWELDRLKKANSEPGTVLSTAHLDDKLTTMLDLTDGMVATVRRIASDLRPVVLDILGLGEAIQWQAQQFKDRTGIAIDYDANAGNVALNPEQSTAVFRIFQEALTNICRHAGATRVDVRTVTDSRELILTVRDNGRGITDSERSGILSIGLLGMRERARAIGGELDVAGTGGQGTTITLRLPLGG